MSHSLNFSVISDKIDFDDLVISISVPRMIKGDFACMLLYFCHSERPFIEITKPKR